MARSSPIACLVLSLTLASACTTTRGATARHEPLVVPPPPPRVIVHEPEPPAEVPVTEQEPVPQLPRASRPSREAPRSDAKSSTVTDATPAPGPSEAEAAAKTPATVTPAPELRTVETPDDARATRLVRDTIERAGRTLGVIDYRALPKPSRVQYDMAKRFIEQSEEALKVRNYTAAQLMAEKAATIAKELSGR